MKIVEWLIVFCLFTSLLPAQNGEIRAAYGDVPLAELKMKFYTPDSTAEAVVLYEEAHVFFDADHYGLKIIFKYFGRYKILRKSGTDRGIIKLPVYKGPPGEEEFISKLEGCTYNIEDGKIVSTKLTKDGIFHEQVMGKHHQEKISMPNLKEGSVFEYRYTKETPFSVGDTPETWYFQTSIPMQWCELNLHIPVNLNYLILKRGYIPIHTNTSEASRMVMGSLETGGVNYHIAVKHAPAFKDEPFITSTEDCISKIDFELSSIRYSDNSTKSFTNTWDDLVSTLLKTDHYTETPKKTAYLQPIAELIKLEKDTMQQLKKALELVAANIEWDHHSTVFAREDSKKVFELRKGNVTEINLMLISLLKQIGLKANPVILSTRGNGQITEEYPSLDQFNYTIACVTLNGKDILLDATEPLLKLGMLPERCLNGKGRLIKQTGSRFVLLKPTQKKVKMEFIKTTLNGATGEITGNAVISQGGYEAYEGRKVLKARGEGTILNDLKKARSEWSIKNFKIENKEDVSESLKYTYDFSFPDNVSAAVIYLNPMFSGRIESNPFTQQERLYPVDLAMGADQTYVANITIPEGYVVEEFPKSVNIALAEDMGKFTYAMEVAGNVIKVSSRITLNEYHFAPEQYEMLKNFYDRIIQKHAEQVILKKNK